MTEFFPNFEILFYFYRKELGSDFIMSPVRRSLRIHRKSVGVVDKSNDLMTELPDDVEYVMYKANKSIIDTEESQ